MRKFRSGMLCLWIACTLVLTACVNPDDGNLTKAVMNASWIYNYASVQELTENSDLIACICVKGMESYEDGGIVKTKYQAEVTQCIYGEEQKTVEIVMTGGVMGKTLYEVADDPLMDSNDTFIIFARKNTNGTYTILSGPQGRFVLENDAVYSLNEANSEVERANPYSNIRVKNVQKDAFIRQAMSYLEENQ